MAAHRASRAHGAYRRAAGDADRCADPPGAGGPVLEEATSLLHADFATVLRAARRGDDAAWARLYRDLAPALLGYLRGQGARDAEDLVGEVFLQVVRHLDRFSGDEAGFRSWVFTIAHRRLIDQRRQRGRRATEPAPTEDLEAALPAVADAAPDTLAALSTEEVVALLRTLTHDQREVLLLRLVGGLRLAEVAEVTGRPREAVKSLQKRGIEQLRRRLAVRSAPPPAPEDGPRR